VSDEAQPPVEPPPPAEPQPPAEPLGADGRKTVTAAGIVASLISLMGLGSGEHAVSSSDFTVDPP